MQIYQIFREAIRDRFQLITDLQDFDADLFIAGGEDFITLIVWNRAAYHQNETKS